MSAIKGLLAAMFKVGAVGFGGGSALIPVAEKELVDRHKLFSERTYINHTIIANITPGAQALKLGSLAGAQIGSVMGAVLAALAVALPGTVGTVGLLALFGVVGPAAIRYVEFAAVGITAFIIVLLGRYIGKVIGSAPSKNVALGVTLVAYLATGINPTVGLIGRLCGQRWVTHLPQLSAVQLVFVALGIIGVVSLLPSKPIPRNVDSTTVAPSARSLPSAVVFLLIALVSMGLAVLVGGGRLMSLVGLSTISCFGGGQAYIGVADGFFVASGEVSSQVFYGQIVPISNAFAGPLVVKIAAGVGYAYGVERAGVSMGIVCAILASFVVIGVCCSIAAFVMAGYEWASRSAFVRNLSVHILPVICGLLLSTSAAMLLANIDIGSQVGIASPIMGWGSVALVAALWWISSKWRLSDVVQLLLAGGFSLLVLTLVS